MGMLRKLTSVSTLGVVPYRNKDERQAKVAKQTRNAARATAVVSAAQWREQKRTTRAMQAAAPAAPVMPPQPALKPGWYQVQQDPRYIIWWDGMQWHPQSQRLAQPEIPR